MGERIIITAENGLNFFRFKKLAPNIPLDTFRCSISEYETYLREEAFRSQNDHIALTWLLLDKEKDGVAAYMSLIADAIKLSASEKKLHSLDYPFKTLPAVKIAKLAVDVSYQKKYQGIGSFMIHTAEFFTYLCNDEYHACRFLTVDADIEHNENVQKF